MSGPRVAATRASSIPRPSSLGDAIVGSRAAQFAALLLFAALIRCPAWGEWNFGIDDQFYALAGERLLRGDVLYVDIWDRKGPVLYLIFAAIGAVWRSMLTYQLGATLFAAAGAFGVATLARRIAPPRAALLAGLVYLALLSRFEGDNLEAGVFFNPLLITCAAMLLSKLNLLRQGRIDAPLVLGFFAAGLAIAIKQTVALESALFGLTAATLLLRSVRPIASTLPHIFVLALAGAAPMLATGMWYYANGHFPELWNAMVTSNFARGYADPAIRVKRIFTMAGMLAIPLLFSGLGIHGVLRARATAEQKDVLRLVGAWALAALVLIFAFPNIYVHYAQSTLAPLSVLCAGALAYRRPVWPMLAVLIGLSLVLAGTFHLADRWRARPAAQTLVDYVRAQTPSHRLLVWGAPSYLYSLADADPVSPLAFAPHLYEGREWTGHDVVAEVHRTLAARPETVVAQTPLPSSPLNTATVALVDAYVRQCRTTRRFTIYDHNGEQVHTVYSGCAR